MERSQDAGLLAIAADGGQTNRHRKECAEWPSEIEITIAELVGRRDREFGLDETT